MGCYCAAAHSDRLYSGCQRHCTVHEHRLVELPQIEALSQCFLSVPTHIQ